MGYFVTGHRIPSGVGEKCLKGLSLFFESATGAGESFSSAVADQGGYSAIRSVGEEARRVEAIRSFALLPLLCFARG